MSEAQLAEKNKLDPLRPQDLEFGVHAYQQFSCRVKDNIIPDDLLNKDFWAFVVPKMKIGAEIRVIPNDFSWVARVLVTYTDGTNVRLKMLSLVELDDTKPTLLKEISKDYKLVMRGQQKWCVQRTTDGVFIKELIPTKQEAVTWLEKYLLALDGDADAEDFLSHLDY